MPKRVRRGTSLIFSSVSQAVRAALSAYVAVPSDAATSRGTIEPLESRTLLSTSWFVSPNGSDSNAGTISAPFKSIQHAADIAQAGDHVEIRAGTYHEDVAPQHSGTLGAPIVFEAYNNEPVTVSGADPISNWTDYKGSIYSASMSWDLGEGNNQVFVDGTMINEARFPNTSLDPSHPTEGTVKSASDGSSTATIYDPSLSQASGTWVGATIHISPGQAWTSQTGTIISSSPGQVTFQYEKLDRYELPSAGNHYYITGTFKALDTGGEWYRDPSGKLYLETPRGDSPAGHDIEAKHRDFAFDVSGQSYITIQNLNIFAATINSNGGSRGLVINHINAKYTGQFLKTVDGWHIPTNAGINLNGPGDILENSVVQYSAGDGVMVEGSNCRVTNNVIHDVDYDGVDAAAIHVMGNGTEVDHNTIYNAGRSGIVHQASGLKILYNSITAVGLQTTEAGGIYTVGQNGGGSEIAYNKIYSFHSGGYGQTGLFFDNSSSNFYVHNNDVWDVDNALKANGYAQSLYFSNNTLQGSWYSVFNDSKGNWDGTKLIDNVLEGVFNFGSGSSASSNSASASAGIGAGDFSSGASSSIVAVSTTPPPLTSSDGSKSSSGGSTTGSSSGSSNSSGDQTQSTGSSTPPPFVGPVLVTPVVPPAPTTPAAWAAQVQSDRDTIKNTQLSEQQQLVAMNNTLKTDIAAYHTALTQRNKGPQRQDTPSTALAVVGPVAAADSATQVQALSKAIQNDRDAIATYRKEIPVVLSSVRQKLTADLTSLKKALRKSPRA